MSIVKKISIAAGVVLAFASALQAQAQFRLPDSHNQAHQDQKNTQNLIASHKNIGSELGVLNYLQGLQKTEDFLDEDIYGENWESDRVNPYVGVTIPDVMDLDVSGYYPPVQTRVTSNYGYRPRFRRMHRGIDLSLHVGDTVRCAFDGKVRLTKFERRGYGYYVVIRHDNGMETVYGHLSKFLVKPDQRVKAGEPIALGGSTGRSTGPHLHFETRYLGMPINPAAIIDFENHVAHKDVFTFDKATCEKSQKYTPTRKSTKRRTTTARRSSTKKGSTSATKRSASASTKKASTAKKG